MQDSDKPAAAGPGHTKRRKVIGIERKESTENCCFANSILQSLSKTLDIDDLDETLAAIKIPQLDIRTEDTIGASMQAKKLWSSLKTEIRGSAEDFNVSKELLQFLRELQTSSQDTVSSARLREVVRKAQKKEVPSDNDNDFFSGMAQADAGEFLLCLLGYLRRDLGNYSPEKLSTFNRTYGYTVERVRPCTVCGHVLRTPEQGFIHQVHGLTEGLTESRKGAAVKLEDLIKHSLSPKEVSDYRCEECPKKCGKACQEKDCRFCKAKPPVREETTAFKALPRCLVLGVERRKMEWDRAGNLKIVKVPGRIKFPDGPVLLEEEGDGGATQVSYEPVAIVSHIGGSVDSGHYVSFIRDGRVWWRCDDAHVERVHDLGRAMEDRRKGGDPSLIFLERIC